MTQDFLERLKWDVFGHPPYSPDLAPSDYYLFPQLNGYLGGKRFTDEDSFKLEGETWLNEKEAKWYKEGLQKLLPRYQKCMDLDGDYVEK